MSREANRLGIKDLTGKLFTSISVFLANLAVVENELIPTAALRSPFREIVERFYRATEQYHLLTYGQQVVHAVAALGGPAVAAAVHQDLRHLIVDEYQDVNPAQERLVRLLTGTQVELCVVGDDDQAIYQWRGSDVDNIVHFAERYPASGLASRVGWAAGRRGWSPRTGRSTWSPTSTTCPLTSVPGAATTTTR